MRVSLEHLWQVLSVGEDIIFEDTLNLLLREPINRNSVVGKFCVGREDNALDATEKCDSVDGNDLVKNGIGDKVGQYLSLLVLVRLWLEGLCLLLRDDFSIGIVYYSR